MKFKRRQFREVRTVNLIIFMRVSRFLKLLYCLVNSLIPIFQVFELIFRPIWLQCVCTAILESGLFHFFCRNLWNPCFRMLGRFGCGFLLVHHPYWNVSLKFRDCFGFGFVEFLWLFLNLEDPNSKKIYFQFPQCIIVNLSPWIRLFPLDRFFLLFLSFLFGFRY